MVEQQPHHFEVGLRGPQERRRARPHRVVGDIERATRLNNFFQVWIKSFAFLRRQTAASASP
jgi:hypothetical protein